MVIFNSYVSLPEGMTWYNFVKKLVILESKSQTPDTSPTFGGTLLTSPMKFGRVYLSWRHHHAVSLFSLGSNEGLPGFFLLLWTYESTKAALHARGAGRATHWQIYSTNGSNENCCWWTNDYVMRFAWSLMASIIDLTRILWVSNGYTQETSDMSMTTKPAES